MSFPHNWISQHVTNKLTHWLAAAAVSVERCKLAVWMYRQMQDARTQKKENPFTDPRIKIL